MTPPPLYFNSLKLFPIINPQLLHPEHHHSLNFLEQNLHLVPAEPVPELVHPDTVLLQILEML